MGKNSAGEWVQIDLGSDMDVTGIILQGKNQAGCPYVAKPHLVTIKVGVAKSDSPTEFEWCDGSGI